jgi:hypothetical protein
LLTGQVPKHLPVIGLATEPHSIATAVTILNHLCTHLNSQVKLEQLKVCLVRWTRRDKEGWDMVILFFMVFDWEATLSVKDEHQEIWDKLIIKKIMDELIPHHSYHS